jgi:signal transduction histidine kinase/CheY-like chemotaxis protein
MLDLVASQSRGVFFAVLGATALLLVICYVPRYRAWQLAWACIVLCAQMLRVRIQTRMPQATSTEAIQTRVRQGIFVAALAGGTLGLILLSFAALDDSARSVLTLVVLGLVTGAVSNSAGHTATYWAFSLPLILSLSLCWLLVPGNEHTRVVGLGLGVAILVGFSSVLAMYARAAWRIFDESCRIRFRESALNQRLTQALLAEEKASKAKTRFLAAASHDLRQPLHTISFVGAALSLRDLDPESVRMVTLLNKVSTSLSAQLDSLLDVSKLDAGVVAVDLQPVSLLDLLQRFHAEFSVMANAKGLQAPLQLDPRKDATVLTDPALLQRVIMNLGQNALKFTEQGQIALRLQVGPDRVEVAIADTGCGIAKELQEEVFQEFFQIANHERDANNGLGLGLSIVQRLCHLLGIQLTLESAPGMGTTVRLTMARLHATSPGQAEPSAAPAAQGREQFGLGVLVIDDEASVRQACAYVLRELGCSVRDAEDLPSARAQCTSQPPDLLIVDLRLRGPLNGIELVQALRQEFGALPALLVTGDTAPDRLRLAQGAGLRLCHKPLTLAKLTEELHALRA